MSYFKKLKQAQKSNKELPKTDREEENLNESYEARYKRNEKLN